MKLLPALTDLCSHSLFSVYAYIPTPNNLCSESSIICNSDFGVSIDRGTFTFTSGQYVAFRRFFVIPLIRTHQMDARYSARAAQQPARCR